MRASRPGLEARPRPVPPLASSRGHLGTSVGLWDRLPSHVDHASSPALDQGRKTARTDLSVFSLNIAYPSGPSASGMTWVARCSVSAVTSLVS